MKELLEKVINKYSDNYIEIHFEEKEFNYIGYLGKELDNVGSAKVSSGNVRVFKNGDWSFISFNDKDIEKHIKKALDNLKYFNSKKNSLLKSEGVIKKSLKYSNEKNSNEIPLDEKVNLMEGYNNRILAHNKINSSRVSYKDELKRSYFVNSEGSSIEIEKLFTGISLSAMAKDDMNIQHSSYSDAGYYGFDVVEDKESYCDKVSKNAIDLLSAKQVEKGVYNVILDPKMAGVFAHEAFGHLSESDFIYENEDIQKMMTIGREFASNKLNIIDDATIEGLAGHTPYDDEGIKGKKTYLIKDGRLFGRLNSRETAYKLREGLSGNARAINPLYPPIVRMTNTFIDKGDYTFEQLLSIMGDGVYCIDFLGGMTNLEMFTFTAGRAYEVKGGKIKRLLRDVVLTGNVFNTLKNIKAIGNDLRHFGGLGGCGKAGQNGLPVTIGAPHILVGDVVVAGK